MLFGNRFSALKDNRRGLNILEEKKINLNILETFAIPILRHLLAKLQYFICQQMHLG
jgi:hypothetical protein